MWIEKALQVALDGSMVGVRGINQAGFQALDGRTRRHGCEGCAPEVSGALIVSSRLLKAGGKSQNLRVAGIEPEGLADPGFRLCHIGGRKSRPDSSLVIA